MLRTQPVLLYAYLIIASQTVVADYVEGYGVTYQCEQFKYMVSVPGNGCDDLSECGDPIDTYSYYVKEGKKRVRLNNEKGKPLIYKNQKVYFDGDQLFTDKNLKNKCKKLSTYSN